LLDRGDLEMLRRIGALALSFSIAGCGVLQNSQNNAPQSADAKPQENVQQTGTSTFAAATGKVDCDLNVNVVNSTFKLARVVSRNSPVHHVLVRERSTNTGCTNSEGLTGAIALEGWVDSFEAGRAPTWQSQGEGHEGRVDGNFYRITKQGCCGATPASAYFNLLSGKKMFESTPDLIRVEVPNTANVRYVAFLDTQSSMNPEETKPGSDVIGALQYGSAEGPGERIVMKLKSTVPFSVEDLSVVSAKEPAKYAKELELWSANGNENPSAIGDFKIRIKLIEVGGDDRAPVIVVPVSSDRLDIDHAVASHGVKLGKTQ
jgi:hypothetical protein